jgi:hypothetical protein
MGRAHSADNGFTAVFGTRRGEAIPNETSEHTRLRYGFAHALHASVRSSVEQYVYSHLGLAHARCQWLDDNVLHIVCARECTRDPGIVRIHLQRLAGCACKHFT